MKNSLSKIIRTQEGCAYVMAKRIGHGQQAKTMVLRLNLQPHEMLDRMGAADKIIHFRRFFRVQCEEAEKSESWKF